MSAVLIVPANFHHFCASSTTTTSFGSAKVKSPVRENINRKKQA